MSPADLQFVAQAREVRRRQDEAEAALLVQLVDDTGAYLADGHRTVGAWGRATHNWSPPEAARMVKLARVMRWLPEFTASALAGELGVAQMHAIAAIATNPRVREHLDDVTDRLFTNAARDLDFNDLSTLLRHWEQLADADGAKGRHDRAVSERRAAVTVTGERGYLDAQGPAYDGVMFQEILEHFTQLEWQHEWDVLAAIHGDRMCAALMERSHSQRCFDALMRIFAAAAGSDTDGPAVTVDITIDQTTFEHELERLAGGTPDPIPASHAPNRHCHDRRGRPVDPRAVLAAALVGRVRRKVIGADGVVLDLGRRQRLFRGPLRDAVLAGSPRCTHRGCLVIGDHCEADHLQAWSQRGPTNAANGAPRCNFHNRWRNNGGTTIRDANGCWHTYRPDGTEIGWPVIYTNLDHLHTVLPHVIPPHP